jgi:hypothetical protein
MNQNPIEIDLALAIAEHTRRELTERSQRERTLEAAGITTTHASMRRAVGHGLIRIGYWFMAPRDRVPPRTLTPVQF